MAEALAIPSDVSKKELYEALLPQIDALISGNDDLIANLANIAAVLKEAFDFHWVGFYRVTAPQILTLGPFQGPLACVTIPFSKGVCGAAAREKKTFVVADVDAFPGHIACSSLSKSEIVVPLLYRNETQLILDIDSDVLNDFDETDTYWLERIVHLVAQRHFI